MNSAGHPPKERAYTTVYACEAARILCTIRIKQREQEDAPVAVHCDGYALSPSLLTCYDESIACTIQLRDTEGRSSLADGVNAITHSVLVNSLPYHPLVGVQMSGAFFVYDVETETFRMVLAQLISSGLDLDASVRACRGKYEEMRRLYCA